MIMKLLRTRVVAVALFSMATLACAQIKVDNAWVRATVPGQQATGAFMKITSIEAVKLSSVSSPAASISEIHEMKMDGGVMKMRALPSGLDIPANRAVELSSGGFHVRMMDLKKIDAKTVCQRELHPILIRLGKKILNSPTGGFSLGNTATE